MFSMLLDDQRQLLFVDVYRHLEVILDERDIGNFRWWLSLGGRFIDEPEDGFEEWGRLLGGLAAEVAEGRSISFLEGGYDLTMLGELVARYLSRHGHIVITADGGKQALRTLRLAHYAAWLGRRWEDPAFPHSFTWFNTERYWAEQAEEDGDFVDDEG